MTGRRLLIVEDDAVFARTLARSFERRGYQVLHAEGAQRWPSDLDTVQLRAAAESLDAAAAAAKTLQFQLARAASGRTPRVDASAQAFVSGYDTGMQSVRDAVGMGE